MDHHIIVIDLSDCKARIVKATKEDLQRMDDCEDYVIIDPLTNQVFIAGNWEPIPTAQIKEHNNIVHLEP